MKEVSSKVHSKKDGRSDNGEITYDLTCFNENMLSVQEEMGNEEMEE